jgi:UDP-2,3-diacylglucosamine pyrophosphatase LpxH
LGDIGYEFLLKTNKLFNRLRKYFGYKHWSLSKTIKHKVKEASNFIGRFENILCDYATKKGCDGVLAGHIHTPCIKEIQGVTYYNCGDWLENATAIIEYEDGTILLYDYLQEN